VLIRSTVVVVKMDFGKIGSRGVDPIFQVAGKTLKMSRIKQNRNQGEAQEESKTQGVGGLLFVNILQTMVVFACSAMKMR